MHANHDNPVKWCQKDQGRISLFTYDHRTTTEPDLIASQMFEDYLQSKPLINYELFSIYRFLLYIS